MVLSEHLQAQKCYLPEILKSRFNNIQTWVNWSTIWKIREKARVGTTPQARGQNSVYQKCLLQEAFMDFTWKVSKKQEEPNQVFGLL